MPIRKYLLSVPALLLVCAAAVATAAPGGAPSAASAADASAASPSAVVEQVSKQIIAALNANEAKLKADPQYANELVKKNLLPHLDFDLTSQLVLGRYWRTATPAQREAFQQAFIHYLTATYAKGLQYYDGARVEVFPFRGDSSERYVKVRSQIVIPNRPPVGVNYALVKSDGGWKVFDVIIEGISYVRTYQTEFQSEIRHTSLDALIHRLQTTKAPKTLTAMKAAMPSTASGQ